MEVVEIEFISRFSPYVPLLNLNMLFAEPVMVPVCASIIPKVHRTRKPYINVKRN